MTQSKRKGIFDFLREQAKDVAKEVANEIQADLKDVLEEQKRRAEETANASTETETTETASTEAKPKRKGIFDIFRDKVEKAIEDLEDTTDELEEELAYEEALEKCEQEEALAPEEGPMEEPKNPEIMASTNPTTGIEADSNVAPSIKKAEAEVKKAEAEAKKAEAEVKKVEAEISAAQPQLDKAEVDIKKAEAAIKQAEVEIKKAEVEIKQEAEDIAENTVIVEVDEALSGDISKADIEDILSQIDEVEAAEGDMDDELDNIDDILLDDEEDIAETATPKKMEIKVTPPQKGKKGKRITRIKVSPKGRRIPVKVRYTNAKAKAEAKVADYSKQKLRRRALRKDYEALNPAARAEKREEFLEKYIEQGGHPEKIKEGLKWRERFEVADDRQKIQMLQQKFNLMRKNLRDKHREVMQKIAQKHREQERALELRFKNRLDELYQKMREESGAKQVKYQKKSPSSKFASYYYKNRGRGKGRNKRS